MNHPPLHQEKDKAPSLKPSDISTISSIPKRSVHSPTGPSNPRDLRQTRSDPSGCFGSGSDSLHIPQRTSPRNSLIGIAALFGNYEVTRQDDRSFGASTYRSQTTIAIYGTLTMVRLGFIGASEVSEPGPSLVGWTFLEGSTYSLRRYDWNLMAPTSHCLQSPYLRRYHWIPRV